MNVKEYLEELMGDAEAWIDENVDWFDDFDAAYDELELTITGNADGSYYFNAAKAAEAVNDVIWDPQIYEELTYMGYNGVPTHKGPEFVDVLVRLALLPRLYNDIELYWYKKKDE